MKWSDEFNAELPLVENPCAVFEDEAQKDGIIENGKLLASELQNELGPQDTVQLRIYGGGIDFSWTPNGA